MAKTPDPQPGHWLVTSLDTAFIGAGGNAPALAGWLEYLGHPEMHGGPRVLLGPEWELQANQFPHMEYRTILRELDMDGFFTHAHQLSGQHIGKLDDYGLTSDNMLGATFQLIEEVRYKKPNSMTSPRAHSADVWVGMELIGHAVATDNWDDAAADNARCRYYQMRRWYENHRDQGLLAMNQLLVKYTAVILKARADINELMGKLVKSVADWAATNPFGDNRFELSDLEKVVDLIVSPPKTIKDAAMTMVDGLKDVIGQLTKKPEDSGFGTDPNDKMYGCYRLFLTYLQTANDICEEAAATVDRLVHDPNHGVLAVRNNWVPVPDWTTPCQQPSQGQPG